MNDNEKPQAENEVLQPASKTMASVGFDAARAIELARDITHAWESQPQRDITKEMKELAELSHSINTDELRHLAENFHGLMHGFETTHIAAMHFGYNKVEKKVVRVVEFQIGPMRLVVKDLLDGESVEGMISALTMALDLVNPKRLVDASGLTLNGGGH